MYFILRIIESKLPFTTKMEIIIKNVIKKQLIKKELLLVDKRIYNLETKNIEHGCIWTSQYSNLEDEVALKYFNALK